jgi:YVTN family beta-propeller protein
MRVDAGVGPRSVVFSRDGATAFAIDELVPEITFLDARKHMLLGHMLLENQAKTIFVPRPYGGVLSPAGDILFVSGGLGRSILVVDVTHRKVVRAIDEVGQAPRGIGIARDGKKLFTANGSSNDVSIVDVASGKVDKRVSVIGAPWGLVVGPGV